MSSFVQVTHGNGSGSSASAAFGSNVTTGNAILVFVYNILTNKVTGVSDGTNTYVQLGSTYTGEPDYAMSVWLAENVTGGSITVQVNASSSTFIAFQALEYTGIATSSAFDQQAQSQGNSSSLSCGPSGSTTTANEVVVCGFCLESASATFTAGSGYTGRNTCGDSIGFGAYFVEDQDVTSKAAYTATATATASQFFGGFLVTLAKSGAPPPPPSTAFPNVSCFWMG